MISIDRAKAIILCYGGYPSAWPEQEKEAVLQLLPDSKSLTDLQKEALTLDGFMSFSGHKEADSLDWELDQQCANKVMAQLPEQTRRIEQVPVTFIDNWRSQAVAITLVASAVLAIIGLSNSIQLNTIKGEAEQLSLSEYMALYVDDTFIFGEETTAEDEQLEILAFLEPQIMDDII